MRERLPSCWQVSTEKKCHPIANWQALRQYWHLKWTAKSSDLFSHDASLKHKRRSTFTSRHFHMPLTKRVRGLSIYSEATENCQYLSPTPMGSWHWAKWFLLCCVLDLVSVPTKQLPTLILAANPMQWLQWRWDISVLLIHLLYSGKEQKRKLLDKVCQVKKNPQYLLVCREEHTVLI